MPFNFKILAFISALFFFTVFFALIRRKSVKPFYIFLWFSVALIFLSIVVFEKFYKYLASLLQITDASFIIIVAVIFFLMVYVLHVSIRISELSDRIQELISHTAILERDLRHTRALLSERENNELSGKQR